MGINYGIVDALQKGRQTMNKCCEHQEDESRAGRRANLSAPKIVRIDSITCCGKGWVGCTRRGRTSPSRACGCGLTIGDIVISGECNGVQGIVQRLRGWHIVYSGTLSRTSTAVTGIDGACCHNVASGACVRVENAVEPTTFCAVLTLARAAATDLTSRTASTNVAVVFRSATTTVGAAGERVWDATVDAFDVAGLAVVVVLARREGGLVDGIV